MTNENSDIKNSSKDEEIDENTLEDISDGYNTFENKLLTKKVMYRLSEEEYTLIILRDVNGLSYVEISKIMNHTAGEMLNKINENYEQAARNFNILEKLGIKGSYSNQCLNLQMSTLVLTLNNRR